MCAYENEMIATGREQGHIGICTSIGGGGF